jgi:hypothetical protein
MSHQDKLLAKILLGTSDANIPFDGICQLLRNLVKQVRTVILNYQLGEQHED